MYRDPVCGASTGMFVSCKPDVAKQRWSAIAAEFLLGYE